MTDALAPPSILSGLTNALTDLGDVGTAERIGAALQGDEQAFREVITFVWEVKRRAMALRRGVGQLPGMTPSLRRRARRSAKAFERGADLLESGLIQRRRRRVRAAGRLFTYGAAIANEVAASLEPACGRMAPAQFEPGALSSSTSRFGR